MKRQDDQHIAVTGAGTGIGRAIALRLAAEGACLSLLARNVTRLEAVATEIAEAGGRPTTVHACDIADASQITRSFARVHEVNGSLRALVANAGIGGPNTPGPDDRFETLVGVNLIGTYHCLRAAQSRLAEGPGARPFGRRGVGRRGPPTPVSAPRKRRSCTTCIVRSAPRNSPTRC